MNRTLRICIFITSRSTDVLNKDLHQTDLKVESEVYPGPLTKTTLIRLNLTFEMLEEKLE